MLGERSNWERVGGPPRCYRPGGGAATGRWGGTFSYPDGCNNVLQKTERARSVSPVLPDPTDNVACSAASRPALRSRARIAAYALRRVSRPAGRRQNGREYGEIVSKRGGSGSRESECRAQALK